MRPPTLTAPSPGARCSQRGRAALGLWLAAHACGDGDGDGGSGWAGSTGGSGSSGLCRNPATSGTEKCGFTHGPLPWPPALTTALCRGHLSGLETGQTATQWAAERRGPAPGSRACRFFLPFCRPIRRLLSLVRCIRPGTATPTSFLTYVPLAPVVLSLPALSCRLRPCI